MTLIRTLTRMTMRKAKSANHQNRMKKTLSLTRNSFDSGRIVQNVCAHPNPTHECFLNPIVMVMKMRNEEYEDEVTIICTHSSAEYRAEYSAEYKSGEYFSDILHRN